MDRHVTQQTLGDNAVVVACQGTSGQKSGWLQSFDRSSLMARGSALRTYFGPNNHPNVGNGLMMVEDNSSIWTVYPVVNAGTGSADTQASKVEFRRFTDNTPTCDFWHETPDAFGRRSLGAVSAVAIEGRAYVAACGWNCDDLYIYAVDPDSRSCGARLVSVSRARGGNATPQLRQLAVPLPRPSELHCRMLPSHSSPSVASVVPSPHAVVVEVVSLPSKASSRAGNTGGHAALLPISWSWLMFVVSSLNISGTVSQLV